MQRLIKDLMLKYQGDTTIKTEISLEDLDDAGAIDEIILTTDSYTIKPLFFPGGDIGRLAISGTVNDIAVMGADPIALSSAFLIEEGFAIEDLEKILKSMHIACNESGVRIITGDTKVVERGSLDNLIINTSGIGKRSALLDDNLRIVKRYRNNFNALWLKDSNIRSGDEIILSGSIGNHGAAIISAREDFVFESNILSDVAPLNNMIKKALAIGGIVSIKDPTRGGIANLLNEWSEKSHIGIMIEESKVQVNDNVKSALGFLGIDPFEVGNEGKICIAVVKEKANEVLCALRETKEGKDASIIGEATDEFDVVVVNTVVGGKRILPPPAGDPIPRIC
jgi:hydrogenase expression/formation protein HypE